MNWTLWRPALLFVVALAIAVVAVLGVRGTTTETPPREFDKGMWVQPKAKEQSTSRVFADGRVDRMPPAGTIAWGRDAQLPDAKFAINLPEAYAAERMPVTFDRALLERGEVIFDRYCMLCHGTTGDGKGVTTQFGMNQPPALFDERLLAMRDGEIFQIITEGKNTMGPLGGRIRPKDRWAAVAWVRALQAAHTGTIDDVPADERPELETLDEEAN
ncbi:MAG: cytochrome c [Planctomycetota bacterium]